MIYLIVCETTETCKIGYSNNPKTRFSQLQTSNPNQLYLGSVIQGDINLEKELHEKFKDFKVRGEWFSYNKDIVDYFNNNPTADRQILYYENPLYINTVGIKYISNYFNFTQLGRIIKIAEKVKGTFNIIYLDKDIPYTIKSLMPDVEYTYSKYNDFIKKLIEHNIIYCLTEYQNRKSIEYILFNPYIAKRETEIHNKCLKHFKNINETITT